MAFYKEQLTLFSRTQARHYKEHYGPSNIQNTAHQRALAIPYVASNQSNERSRFGNALETINYTIQSLLIEGLNEALLQDAIIQWQIEARGELLEQSSTYASLAETPTAQRINKLLHGTGLTLQEINLRSDIGPQQLSTLFAHLQRNRPFLYALLQEQILTRITVEPAILHSDAYNHVDMYRSSQGLSGTPWNHSTYHQHLQYNALTSLGTDGYIQSVLKHKQTPIAQLTFTQIDTFLTQLLQTNPNARAIIDISATFAGVSNLTVAHQLAKQCTDAIQYVLYFNEDDVLCALDTRTQQSRILATSDPDEIDQKLGCTPNQRFTYYDQSHTVGTDLKQAPTAHAFVLADSRTHLQSLLQGCMRMRGLDEQQTVSIIVPNDTPNTLDNLYDLMAKNEQDQLKEDNYFAALAKMDNIVRQALLQRIANTDNIDRRYAMAQAFQHHFIETKQLSLFEQYGSICVERFASELFEQHRSTLINDWLRCIGEADTDELEDEPNTLDTRLRAIIEQSIPLCKEKSMSRANPSQAMGTEVEHERETLKEEEKETLKEAMYFNPNLSSAF